MKLISDYKGSDFNSIEADNTSAFNCRAITGNAKKWSNHAYGIAIDINPIENPYISKSGRIAHKKSYKYRERKSLKGVILKDDNVERLFKKYGWKWGGDWITIKDYQHFEYSLKKLNQKKDTKTISIKKLMQDLNNTDNLF